MHVNRRERRLFHFFVSRPLLLLARAPSPSMLRAALALAARRSNTACPTWLPGAAVSARAGACEPSTSFTDHVRSASSDTSSSSSSGHMPHLARPTQDRRAETTKWSLLHEQGHDVNPCNSK